MARLPGFLVLLTLVAAVACGDGRVSVSEYAMACGALGEDIDQGTVLGDVSDFSGAITFLEHSLVRLEELKPPEELQRLHELKVTGSELALSVLKEIGFDDLQADQHELESMSPEEQAKRSAEIMESLAERLELMEEAFAKLEEGLGDLQAQVVEEQGNLSPETYEIMAREGCISIF